MRNIVVNLEVEGLHKWEDCNIKEVSFLKNKHRHLFHICCKKQVEGCDREIEIINFKRSVCEWLHKEYGTKEEDNTMRSNLYYVVDFGGMSCEMIAEKLLNAFNLSYCEVLEDGENGAEIYKSK